MTRVVVVLLGCACATTGGGADVGSAVVNAAIAGTVAGVRRANGECYAPCTPGTTCNQATGLCDPLPCRGECVLGETCERSGLSEKCVPAAAAIAPELAVSETLETVPPRQNEPQADAGVGPSRAGPQQLILPR